MPKKRKVTPRPPDAEILQRVNDVYKLLVRGASRSEIVQYSSKEWGITDRQADTYMKRARAYFNQRIQVERDQELGQALERYEMLFQRAFKVQDYKTCIQAQARIDKIMGLEQNNITVKTWQDEALDSIKRGELDYDTFMEHFNDANLAHQLFAQAGIAIEVNE